MRNLFISYRVLAAIVGVLLLIGTFLALPFKYLAAEGSGLQDLGEQLSLVWLVHGWIYIIYVVVAFLLSRRAGWSLTYLLLMLVAGLIPVLIFWVEHKVASRLKAEHPELA